MDGWKNQIEFIRRKLKKVKTWHMVVLLLILVILSIFFLRLNNMGMVELRNQVLSADESGDGEVLQRAATKLQNYVSGHMNADTGQIALQNSYDRAIQRAFSEVNDVNASGYAEATESCKAVLYVSGYPGYASCVADAVGIGESTLVVPELPNPALYYISYASPIVSFDAAGVTVVLSVVVFLAIILKLLTEVVMALLLYKKQQA
jgi:hypothetical protein